MGWQIVKHFVLRMMQATEFSKLSETLKTKGRELTHKQMKMLHKVAEGWEI